MLAIDALKDLQKKFAERLNDKFPDDDIAAECNSSIKQIRNIYSTKVQDIDFSNTSLVKPLPNLLKKYINKGINDFTVMGIELLSAWFYHSIFRSSITSKENGKDFLYQIKSAALLTKVFSLFTGSKVNKSRVCENLLYGYLQVYDNCSQQFASCLKAFVEEMGKIENLSYYFDRERFAGYFVYEKFENYSAFLALCKIKKNFHETKYFQDFWFDWAMKGADVLSKKFLSKDFVDKIDRIGIDKKKVLTAFIACKADLEFDDNAPEKDLYFKNYLLQSIGKNNPIHEEYWNVEKKFKNDYAEFLDAAPKIFRKYYTSEFILIFFDAYESAGGDDARAVFWRLYKNKINDFVLGVSDENLYKIKTYIQSKFRDDLVKNYLSILSDYTLRLYTAKSAVLVLAFDKIIAVEFSEIGNAVYVYENSPHARLELLKGKDKNSEDDFKDKSVANDWWVHSGRWQYNFQTRLEDNYGIKP